MHSHQRLLKAPIIEQSTFQILMKFFFYNKRRTLHKNDVRLMKFELTKDFIHKNTNLLDDNQ